MAATQPRPVRQVQVRQPASKTPREFLVRLWEVERKKKAVPEQLRSFKVTANSLDAAQRLARRELEAERRRVVRSLSYTADGTIQAVVFKGLHRHAPPRDHRSERKASLDSRRRRRARGAQDPAIAKKQAEQARQAARVERKRTIEETRTKLANVQEQAALKIAADRRERHAEAKVQNETKLSREAHARAKREAAAREHAAVRLAKRGAKKRNPKPTTGQDAVVGR